MAAKKKKIECFVCLFMLIAHSVAKTVPKTLRKSVTVTMACSKRFLIAILTKFES